MEEKNFIKIEGSDNLRLFTSSKELQGCFRYKGHYFFLLSDPKEIFCQTKQVVNLSQRYHTEFIEDDRWTVYYFGFDQENYYFYGINKYSEKKSD